MPLRVGEEVQEMLRWGNCELNLRTFTLRISSMQKCGRLNHGSLVMKRREGYKGYVIEARSHELRDGGFSSEFSIEEHDASGVDEGFEPRSAVASG